MLTKEKIKEQINQIHQKTLKSLRSKISKKNIFYNTPCTRQFILTLLNSFLQDGIFDNDLLNEIWEHHFQQDSEPELIEVMEAYSSSVAHLAEKIIIKEGYKHQLKEEKEEANQTTKINLIKNKIEAVKVELITLKSDFSSLNAPLQQKFEAQLLEILQRNLTFSKSQTLKTKNQQSQQKQEEQIKPKRQQQPQQDKAYKLTLFIYLTVIILEVAISFNKFNFVNVFIVFLLFFNGIFQNLFLKESYLRKQLVDIEYDATDRMLRQKYYHQSFIGYQQQVYKPHQYYLHSTTTLFWLTILIIWDILWLLIFKDSYYSSINAVSHPQTINFFNPMLSFPQVWRFNRFILYASYFNLIAKVIILQLKFIVFVVVWCKVNYVKVSEIFKRESFCLLFLRFGRVKDFIIQQAAYHAVNQL